MLQVVKHCLQIAFLSAGCLITGGRIDRQKKVIIFIIFTFIRRKDLMIINKFSIVQIVAGIRDPGQCINNEPYGRRLIEVQ